MDRDGMAPIHVASNGDTFVLPSEVLASPAGEEAVRAIDARWSQVTEAMRSGVPLPMTPETEATCERAARKTPLPAKEWARRIAAIAAEVVD